MNVQRTAILFLLFLAAASCATGLSQKNREDASIHYRLGEVHFNERNYTSALKELTRAVELDPKNPDYHHLLGLTYFIGKRMYNEAIAHFKEAIRLKPGFSEAHMNLGAVYLELKSWDTAIPHFEAALEDIFYRTPEWAYNNLGWAYYNKGDYRNALVNYKKAVEINQRFAMAFNNMGLTYDRTENTEEAVNAFKTAIALVPDFLDAHYNLGVVLVRHKDKAGALKAFERVVEIAPGSDKARSAREYIELIR
jgi:tetratricopeptide (TPR) repeat protein